jgi:hypothetical protein
MYPMVRELMPDLEDDILESYEEHHVEEEEDEWFPKVRKGLGRKQMQQIGVELQAARAKAPRAIERR